MRSVLQLALVTMVGCLFVAGCGQTGERTYGVSGIVTLNNEPVSDAVVTFLPVAGGQPVVAKTDATGRFTASAPAGQYRVKLEKFVAEGQQSTAAAGGEYQEAAPDVTPPGSRNVLPAKYADPSTSGFQVEVKAGDNSFTFNLEEG